MNSKELFNKGLSSGFIYECTCVGISQNEWDKLMKNHTKADRRIVVKAALESGIIDSEEAVLQIRKPYYNPHTHFKTKTHFIYVYSGIEHFIKIGY
jgi:hypothetical protein